MIQSGENPDVATYTSLLHGYATEGNLVEMNNVKDLMVQNGMRPDRHVFNIQMYAYSKCGMLDPYI
jgi:pentatricopeptide repeat protein